jgi:ribosomal protein S6--L-glutamate ligase
MRGHEMHFLNIKECYMKLDAKHPHYRGGKILNQFDAIIPESDLVLLFTAVLTRQFELKSVLPELSKAITQSRDKLYLTITIKSWCEIPLLDLPIHL